MNFQLKKYSAVSYDLDGLTVYERIPCHDGQTPEQHEAEILGFIANMRETFNTAVFSVTTRYEYELIDDTTGI